MTVSRRGNFADVNLLPLRITFAFVVAVCWFPSSSWTQSVAQDQAPTKVVESSSESETTGTKNDSHSVQQSVSGNDATLNEPQQLQQGTDERELAEILPPPVVVADADALPPSEPNGDDNSAADTEASQPEPYVPLTEGPLHEAFAAPVDLDPSGPQSVHSKPPPEPVAEQPPKLSEDATGLQWIPGYWAWDDAAEDYVWVSGLYRRVPPGRTWVPGSWTKTEAGYQWTPGYWKNTQVADQPTLPQPPKSIDNGPSTPAPSEEHFWVPGYWEYVAGQYRWHSGFWSRQPDRWIWQPACYVQSTYGYVFVDGYWDYLPDHRGIIYSPVTFISPVYRQPGYVYYPRYRLGPVASLLVQLFVRPGCSYYYYGNFYGPRYYGAGFYPWFGLDYRFRYRTPWIDYYRGRYGRYGINFVDSMNRYAREVSRYNQQGNRLGGGLDRIKSVGSSGQFRRDAPPNVRNSKDLVKADRAHRYRTPLTIDDIVRDPKHRVPIVANLDRGPRDRRQGGSLESVRLKGQASIPMEGNPLRGDSRVPGSKRFDGNDPSFSQALPKGQTGDADRNRFPRGRFPDLGDAMSRSDIDTFPRGRFPTVRQPNQSAITDGQIQRDDFPRGRIPDITNRIGNDIRSLQGRGLQNRDLKQDSGKAIRSERSVAPIQPRVHTTPSPSLRSLNLPSPSRKIAPPINSNRIAPQSFRRESLSGGSNLSSGLRSLGRGSGNNIPKGGGSRFGGSTRSFKGGGGRGGGRGGGGKGK